MPDGKRVRKYFAEVRQRKLAHFLKTFGPAALPEGPELAAMMGSFQFLVDGWNDDPNELYAIPEIRKFYQHFHEVWPYWFYFCDLHTETLQMMTLCLLPNLKGFKRVGEPKAAVEYDPGAEWPLLPRDGNRGQFVGCSRCRQCLDRRRSGPSS